MRLIRIASTSWMRTPAELRAVDAFGGAPQRVLGALAGPWVAPALSTRLTTPVALSHLLRALGGRMVVANPVVAARLPAGVTLLARAVLAARLDGTLGDRARVAPAQGASAPAADEAPPTMAPPVPSPIPSLRSATRATEGARRIAVLLERLPSAARDALVAEGPATWVAAALLEPRVAGIELADAGGDLPTAPARFLFEPRYRLVLAAGTGAPPTWEELEARAAAAPAVAWPSAREHTTWFATPLLVPDALVTEGMDEATLARWAALTGRAGPASRDRYWFAESWDRFREPGRMIGHVTPQLVARSRHSGRAASEPAADGALALTNHVERGVAVPPGYCLVDCAGTLEVALVTA